MAATESKMYVDEGKRGRLLALGTLIGVSLFVVRALEIVDINSNREIFLLAFIYGVGVYIALIVLFKFKVTWRSLLVVIPQSSIFVAAEVLFVLMFFFREFERVFDFVYLLVLMGIVVFVSYAHFLMTNIFNVASFKPIPLVQVATTASYVSTVILLYFVSFAFTNISLSMGWIFLLLFVHYLIICGIHFLQMSLRGKQVLMISLVTAIVGCFSLFAVLIWGQRQELAAIVPATVAFGIIGLEMAALKSQVAKSVILQYFLVVVVAVLVNFFFN